MMYVQSLNFVYFFNHSLRSLESGLIYSAALLALLVTMSLASELILLVAEEVMAPLLLQLAVGGRQSHCLQLLILTLTGDRANPAPSQSNASSQNHRNSQLEGICPPYHKFHQKLHQQSRQEEH
jgi:hypothetical protein